MAAVNHALNTGKMDDDGSDEWTWTGESRSVGARFTVGSIVVLGVIEVLLPPVLHFTLN